jgi:quinol monooxygenase YgiN
MIAGHGMEAMVDETREYVVGWLTVAPGTREEFLKVAGTYAAAFREEEGCLFFEMNPSLDDADSVTFMECFATPEVHGAHMAAPQAGAFWKELERFGRQLRFETIRAGRVELASVEFDGANAS